MKIYLYRCSIYCLLSLLILLPLQSANAHSTNRQRRQNDSESSRVVQGYLPFWNDGDQPDAQVISRLSTVVLAFAVPQKDGSVSYDRSLQANLDRALKAIRQAKEINPQLKFLWAIGGWSDSGNFTVAVSPALRRKFIDNILVFLDRFKADGLDVDWEFPKISDRANLTAFIGELSAEAKRRGKDYQLTMAVNSVEGDNTIGLDIPKLAAFLHHFNVMTYDFYGDWSPVAGLHSAAYPSLRLTDSRLNAQAGAEFYLKNGVPPEKIVIGANSHGRIQTAAPGQAGDGLGEKSSGAGKFIFLGKNYTDEISSSEIEKLPPREWQRFFDRQAQAPYLYNPAKRIFISYDDARSVRAKIKLVKEKDLGGMMLWDLPGDADHELINAMLGGFEK